MSCFYPKLAFQNTVVKQRIRWTGLPFYSDSWKNNTQSVPMSPEWKPIKTPCGGCLDCRLTKSREMAVRCVHEAEMNADKGSIFVTLTYNEESLPKNNTFDFTHPVKFMKRLRRLYGKEIKSYGCAEYGEKGGRPHYHLLIFGLRPDDLYFWRNSRNPRLQSKLYRSPSIERIWGTGKGSNFKQYGNVEIGDVTFQSAAYVARYVLKKNKKKTELERELGRFHEKAICVSRREGIGFKWLKRYYTDVYNGDSVHYRGAKQVIQKIKPPKYYDRKAEELKLIDLEKIKLERMILSDKNNSEQTKQRKMVKQHIKREQIKQLRRSYEHGT